MRLDPVIVLAMHRSGSTYLTRLLNAVPNLVVWGEHGGFLVGARNSLNATQFRLPGDSHWNDVGTIKSEVQSKFLPFMNPFSGHDYEDGMRTLLTALLTKNLPKGTRWGFKEIRYLSRAMVDFIFQMWPDAKLIFNLRDPIDLCVSSLRARWVVERLQKGLKGYTADKIEEVVFNTLVRIYTMERLSIYAQGKYGTDRAHTVWYEDLAEDPGKNIRTVLKFLSEHNFDETHVERTSTNVVGKALKFDPSQSPELAPENIHDVATELKHSAYNLNFDKFKVDSKWDFCIGVMPGDQVAFDFNA